MTEPEFQEFLDYVGVTREQYEKFNKNNLDLEVPRETIIEEYE